MIDLSKCKSGDKLISKHGLVLTYIEKLPDADYYDHLVMYPNGSYGSRTNDGYVFKNEERRLQEDNDIVEIIHVTVCG